MAVTAKDAKITAELLVNQRDTLRKRIQEYHDSPESHRENPQAKQIAREWVVKEDLITDILAALNGSPGSLKFF